MSVSQNTENEQQNNLCTTLTEQWKKGELEYGYYYVDFLNGKSGIKQYGEIAIKRAVKNVKAPVPSYEEWQQLKELLKEAKDIIEWYKADCGYKDTPTEAILTKIDNAIGEKK